MSDRLDAALSYAKSGLPIFPLHTPVTRNGKVTCSCGGEPGKCKIGKHPRIAGGFLNATADISQVRKWWSQWPDANIGLACGEVSGIDALDIDGEVGECTFTGLELEHGRLPDTPTSITGGGVDTNSSAIPDVSRRML